MEMQIQIETLMEVYKQEIQRLQDENLVLKVRLLQLEKDTKREEEEEQENE